MATAPRVSISLGADTSADRDDEPNNANANSLSTTTSKDIQHHHAHHSAHKRRNGRPTSLSLAGEWIQRGVKSLGSGLGMSSWATATEKRASLPLSRPSDVGNGTTAPGEVQVPQVLQEGTWMTKVSGKNRKKMFLRLDADMGHIIWHSKQPRIIPIENIKEIRSGPSTRFHRHHFQLAQEYENLWLTIIYILEGHYKILHLIAPSEDIFRMWDATLRKLHAHRMQLMTGLGNIEERQRVWEKQYWRGADVDRDQRLTFDEVEKMCRRLNINSPREDLFGWFKQADLQNRRYLDFEDFRRFVKLLKTRREILTLFNHLKGSSELFDFDVFTKFMRRDQKSTLPTPALLTLFEKYSVPVSIPASTSTSPPTTPHPSKETHFDFRPSAPQQRTLTTETLTSFLLSPDNAPFASPSHSSLPPKPTDPPTITTTSSLPSTKHDMTHPLSSYFISSSHNTYLVGHQLVGSSTVEGYIRALLAGCRSVEIDIYDGSGSNDSASEDPTTSSTINTGPGSTSTLNEPMVFHGHTLTSKVPLRQVCQAIMKYGFIASPYPIIISAENHCSIQGQDQIARIMVEEFGDALVRYPNDGPDPLSDAIPTVAVTHAGKGKGKLTQLPSPEELKGRILFKTKNLLLGKSDSDGKGSSMASSESDLEPSSSASESDAGMSSGVTVMFGRGLYRRDSERVGGKKVKKNGEGSGGDIVREGLMKANNMLQRVRSVGRSTAPSAIQVTSSGSSGHSTHATNAGDKIPISIHTGTPNASTPQLASQQLVSSPAPMSPPLSSLSSLPLPIPLPRSRSSTSANLPPLSTKYGYPSSVPSVSSTTSSSYHEHGPPQLGAPSSYNGSTSLLSSSTSLSRRHRSGSTTMHSKPKMALSLVALLVYTVGVKCRGFRKSGHIYLHSDENGSVSDTKSTKSTKSKDKDTKDKEAGVEGTNGEEEWYAPEHMFSLSENIANKFLRTCMLDLIKHTEGHLVRVYPRGTRMSSTNFEPHRFWSAGCQLVAINWQTFDLGYVINHAMFQRNARCGYVLKPPPLRHPSKPEHSPDKWRKKKHLLNITIISAQQLPRVKVKDGSGHEVLGLDKDKDSSREGGGEERERERERDGKSVDPFVEVSLHVPEWTYCASPSLPHTSTNATSSATPTAALPESPLQFTTTRAKTHTTRTPTIKNNGFNPIWNHTLQLSFDAPTQPGILDLIFLRLLVKQEPSGGLASGYSDTETLAVCCVSLGEVREGYRHLPLYDAMLSQYLFSTLFVKVSIT